ncbi:MAG TPA: ribosome recycling factor [Firmicutes bacterium]|nr:ribosome recycling factor [Bacillota bacterium]HBM70308.1 ribosome recycling factor [Bacillota bacterium]HBX25433.1 ribosome recycling factor [Bacillota bacterium]
MDAYTLEASEKMNKSVDSLSLGLSKLRSGRANPSMLNGVKCDYYGEKMDITSLCSISMPEPRQLYVKPYSREDLKAVASGIASANLGINPQIEADGIRIVVPPLTEDIRKDIAKKAKTMGDEAKVSIRNIRRDYLSLLKEDDSMSDDYKDRVEEEIQKEVESFNKKIDEIIANKTKEIMTI